MIEVLADSADDCAAVARAGADRGELSSSLGQGGLTPSPRAVRVGKLASALPFVAMLRPRLAGFAYSERELRTMEEDGRVDAERCRRLMAVAPSCREWVLHRAFDLCFEPFEALEEFIGLGVSRTLTRGQANSFEEGEKFLLALRERAACRIGNLVPGPSTSGASSPASSARTPPGTGSISGSSPGEGRGSARSSTRTTSGPFANRPRAPEPCGTLPPRGPSLPQSSRPVYPLGLWLPRT
ncbi:MAG: copper homeostasis protein CutC [Rectinemataceae bacterium]